MKKYSINFNNYKSCKIFYKNRSKIFLKKSNFLRKGTIKNYKIKPDFTIITVVKNNVKFIEKCIKSVLKQKNHKIEYLIIDCESNDGTIKILNKYNNRIDFWISENDNGIYDAMNKAILMSNGRYIGILNSDDQYTKNALNIVNKYIKKFNQPDFIFGSVIKGRLIMSGFHPKKLNYKFNIFPSHSSSFFIKSAVHKKIGLYDINFDYSADYDLIFRLIKNNYRGICTKHNEITGLFYTKGISKKVSFFRSLKEQILIRIKNKQNFIYIFFLSMIIIINKLYNLIFNKKEKRSF